MQLKPIGEQAVVVFGASSGIGRTAALQFARREARLVVAARSESGLASLVDEIRATGAQAVAQTADASDYAQVQAVAERAVSEYGRLDTWVHTAATGIIGRFEDTQPEEFRRVIEVNLLGQIHGAKAALPHLKREGRGALIHVSSVEGRRSLPLQSAYAASKHGIEGFLESLRVELQHDRVPVSVTSILPSVINTPFYNKARTKLGVQPTGIPPYYQPELVADAIIFAAENPVRELVVGDAGRVLDWLQRLSPSLVDTLLVLVGIEAQHTQKPKAESDPNNVDAPAPAEAGFERRHGDFDHMTIPSFLDWLDRYPASQALGAAALGAVALLAGRAFLSDQRK